MSAVHRLVRLALAAAAVLLMAAGCSTTVSTSSGPVSDPPRPGSPGAETPDPARRAGVRMELASAYYSRGQFDVALDEIKQALIADPNLAAAYNLRGLIYASKGENAGAEESYRRALVLSPRDTDAMQNYGWFLCQLKRYGEANAQFVQALAVPTNRDVSRTLLAQGVCLAFADQLDDAEKALMRSFELNPANPSTSVNLAELLLRRGEAERARFHIRRVLAQPQLVNAQTLWLAARIEHKLGNLSGAQELGAQLRIRFAESREAVAFDKGRFDE